MLFVCVQSLAHLDYWEATGGPLSSSPKRLRNGTSDPLAIADGQSSRRNMRQCSDTHSPVRLVLESGLCTEDVLREL
jgi:hypothetical protein